jgi:hypothetical protein
MMPYQLMHVLQKNENKKNQKVKTESRSTVIEDEGKLAGKERQQALNIEGSKPKTT